MNRWILWTAKGLLDQVKYIAGIYANNRKEAEDIARTLLPDEHGVWGIDPVPRPVPGTFWM